MEWGRRMQDLASLVIALDVDIDVEDFPQVADLTSVVVPHWGRQHNEIGHNDQVPMYSLASALSIISCRIRPYILNNIVQS